MKRLLFVIALMFIAIPVMAQNNLQFQWDAHPQAAQLTGFKLYSTNTPGTYGSTPIATFTGGNLTSGTIPKPTTIGTTYYSLTAFAPGGESTRSNEVSYNVSIAPPTGLRNPVLVAIIKAAKSLWAFFFGPHKSFNPKGLVVNG